MNRIARCARHFWFCAADPSQFGGTYAQRERFNTAVFIDPERRFLFTKNEKCGNNTARRTLQSLTSPTPLPADFADTKRWQAPLLQPSDLVMARIEELNERVPFKFAIVRNPYARVLSLYLSKFRREAIKAKRFSRELGVDYRISFAEFVARINRQTPEEMNPHWRVQYYNVYCERIKYGEFVKFEEYETHFASVLGKFFDRTKIESVRKGQFKAAEKITKYYTAEIARTVRDKFKIDFEYFGYDTALPL